MSRISEQWFAWYPVYTRNGGFRWMEVVRKRTRVENESTKVSYRAI